MKSTLWSTKLFFLREAFRNQDSNTCKHGTQLGPVICVFRPLWCSSAYRHGENRKMAGHVMTIHLANLPDAL